MTRPTVFRASELSLRWRLLAWTVVFLIPMIGLWYGGRALVLREEKSLESLARRQLLDEMEGYLQDLQLEGVIEERLDRVQRRMSLPSTDRADRFRFQGDPSQLAAPVLADRLLAEIRRSFGAEPLFLFTTGADCAEVAVRTDPRMISNVQTPPRRLIQQWMIALSGQLDRRPTSNVAFLADLKNRWGDLPGRTRLRADIDRFIRQQFGLYAAPFGSEGECRAFYVNRFGGDRLLLYHRVITTGRDPSSPLLGSFLIGFRESAFSMRQMLIRAGKRRLQAGVERSRVIPRKALGPGFYLTSRGLSYLHHLPEICLVHREIQGRSALQRIRLQPGKALSDTPLPCLVVRVSPTALRHPLRESVLALALLTLLVLFAGFLLLLRGEDTGWSTGGSIRHQLLTAVAIAVGFPLLGLWMIAGSFLSFHQKLDMQRQLLWMNDRLEEFEYELSSFNSTLQGKFWDVSEKLAGLRGASEADTRQALRGLGTDFPSAERFYLLREDGLFMREVTGKDRTPTSRHDNVYLAVLYRLLNGANGMTPQGLATLMRLPDGRMADVLAESISDAELGNFLIDERNAMHPKAAGFQGKQLSYMLLSSKGTRPGQPWGVIMRFDSYLAIIENFIRTSRSPWKLFHLRNDSYSTRLALFLTTGDRVPALVRGMSFPREAWSQSEMLSLARRSIKTHRDGAWIEERGEQRSLAAVRQLTGFPLVAVAVAEPSSLLLERAMIPLAGLTILGLYSCLIIVLIVVLLTAGFLAPIRTLTDVSARVSAGDLTVETRIETGDEFTHLGSEFNRMVRGLRERSRLARFVSEDLGAEAGGSRRVQRSIIFSHLRDFERLVESHAPEAVVELLNGYFTVMEEAVRSEHGGIDKFIGDAVMAVFQPRPGLDPEPVRACRAALAMNAALRNFNRQREAGGAFAVRHGIGIATGEVIAGDIGSESGRLALTVIGDVVNLAARLEANSDRAGGSHVLVCSQTAAHSGFVFRSVGTLKVKGKAQEIEASELVEVAS